MVNTQKNSLLKIKKHNLGKKCPPREWRRPIVLTI